MNPQYRKIGLFDHMGFGNMGDAAIHESFITNIRRRMPDANLIAFSLYPDDTKQRHGLTCYPIRWCDPGWRAAEAAPSAGGTSSSAGVKAFLKKRRVFYAVAKPVHDYLQELAHLVRSYKAVRSLDVLIMAGGGQLCELYADLPYNVFKFCVLAKLARTPVYFVGVGADLLKSPVNKFFARWSVRLAKYACFRSVESQALVRSLGVKRETHVCPDPAYALDAQEYLASSPPETLSPAQARDLLSKLGLNPATYFSRSGAHDADTRENGSDQPFESPARTVGLNPISFCDPRRWPRKDAAVYNRYLRELTAFCSWLLAENYDLEIFTSDLMDLYAMEDLRDRLLAEVPAASASRLSFRPALSLRELLSQMSGFDFVVTSKFHGVIFSHLLGKPVMALSYLPKIDHLMRTVGHDSYCLSVEHVDANWLIEGFQRLAREKSDLKSLFRKTCEAYSRTLKDEFDAVFMPDRRSITSEDSKPVGNRGARRVGQTALKRRRLGGLE
jgi:polysaccharide pyruvyl transferase WcaK-like protein